MMELLKKNSEYVILNSILFIFLFFVLKDFPIPLTDETLFFASDAQEYFATGQSLVDDSIKGSLITRPFLFPLILLVTYSIGGCKLWFILQLGFWIVSVNLLYSSIKKLRISIVLNILGIILFCANFSVIALIYHGLNEVISIFLLCWLMHVIVSNYEHFYSLKNFTKMLLLLVALTLIKPLFLIPSICFLGLLVILHFKTLFRSPKQLLIVILTISPLIIQMGLVKISYDKFTFSEISSKTYRRYIFTQLYQLHHDCDRVAALEATESMSKKEIMEISKEHKQELFTIYQENLELNLTGRSVFLELNRSKENKFFVSVMKDHINLFYNLFYSGFLWVLLFLIHIFYRKKFLKHSGILFIGLMMYYVYLTSGISGLQGDRLVIVALPLAIVFYLYILNYFYTEIKCVIQESRSKRR